MNRESFLMKKILVLLSVDNKLNQSPLKNMYFKHLHEILSHHKKMLNGIALQEIDSLLKCTQQIKNEIIKNPDSMDS